MFKILFKSKVIISIWLVSLVTLSSLFYFIPYIIKKSMFDLIIQNSKDTVTQVKLTRSYYVDFVVNKILNTSSDFTFSANHKKNPKTLPLPATFIHDLGDIFNRNTGVQVRTYSNFPFKNRINRVLSKHDKKTLRQIAKKNGVYISKDIVNNQPVLKVAIADYMTEVSCVNCHNNNPKRTWSKNKWKLGDIRGVIEITTPLYKPLKHIKRTRNYILFFVALAFLFLIIYYSYMLLKREDELLKLNDILKIKVKREIQKNHEKEQILIQKSKLISTGEMINNIAHQWRQPINEISSLLINIEQKYNMKKLNDEFVSQKIKKGEYLLEYLSYTIDDFQNFFKLDKKKIDFSLYEVIKNTINISTISIANDGINIEFDGKNDIILYGYKTELSQVILNILSNAKDALESKEEQDKYIKIKYRQNFKNIFIIIEDNASGIKKSSMNKIFDLYFTDKTKGSGIGLYMSKLIIEKHFNGKIKVSNGKVGAKFTIIIPKHINS